MRLCLYEDCHSSNLEPLTWTRPVFDLLCGTRSLAAKQCRHFAPCDVGVLLRPHLADLYRLEHPWTPTNDLAWLRKGPAVLVNGRWLPPDDRVDTSKPCVGMVEGEVAYVVLGTDLLTYCSPQTIDDCLEKWKTRLPVQAAGGKMIHYLWDLVHHNGSEIARDFRALGLDRSPPPSQPLAVVGPLDRLRIDPTAHIDPLVVFDTREGPIVVEAGAAVHAFSRVEGPCYVGPRTHVLGAKLRAGSSLGPHSRVGGEIEASILHGHANKYHDGFLGHSYVGEWVNLGAGTSNSDLRNDYGEVTMTVAGQRVATGQSKVGCFVGDHTKMGLSTLLNTGSNVGVGCNLLPSGGLLPKHIPSFASWWNGTLADRADLPTLCDTAAIVMKRRGKAFTQAHAAVLQHVFDSTAAERRHAIREQEKRRWRQSA